MLFACVGVISAVTATFAAGLLTMGADALAVDFLAGVTTPWARVFRLTTYFAAVAVSYDRLAPWAVDSTVWFSAVFAADTDELRAH